MRSGCHLSDRTRRVVARQRCSSLVTPPDISITRHLIGRLADQDNADRCAAVGLKPRHRLESQFLRVFEGLLHAFLFARSWCDVVVIGYIYIIALPRIASSSSATRLVVVELLLVVLVELVVQVLCPSVSMSPS